MNIVIISVPLSKNFIKYPHCFVFQNVMKRDLIQVGSSEIMFRRSVKGRVRGEWKKASKAGVELPPDR